MTKRKLKNYNPDNLVKAIEKWLNPMYDKKHKYNIYVEGCTRSNQTRVQHIIEYGHDLKARDLELVPNGINNYFSYKKDPIYKDTYNYYLIRKGLDRGFIKVSVQLDSQDMTRGWVKTVYITYRIK